MIENRNTRSGCPYTVEAVNDQKMYAHAIEYFINQPSRTRSGTIFRQPSKYTQVGPATFYKYEMSILNK